MRWLLTSAAVIAIFPATALAGPITGPDGSAVVAPTASSSNSSSAAARPCPFWSCPAIPSPASTSSAVSASSKVSGVTRVTTRSLTVNVRLTQGATIRHDTSIGRVLSTTLNLFAIGEQLGSPPNTDLGSMSFTYRIFGTCSASTAGCGRFTYLMTVTTFPDGTITAGGTSFPISPLVVPILSGTGIFKGVTGTIMIASGGPKSIYRLRLTS